MVKKEDEVFLDRNYMDLPQDVGLWHSIITDMFVTEYIDTGPNHFLNRYHLSTGHYLGRTQYLSDSLKENLLMGRRHYYISGFCF
jgi:hypothetical protein